MLDSSIRTLLEQVVNTSTKLAIVMLYAGDRGFNATAGHIAQRLWSDIWSVRKALDELVDDGVLGHCDGKYCFAPTPALRDSLHRLLTVYDEPLRRQEIVHLVSELDRYAPYRDLLNNRTVTVYSM